MWLGHNRQVLHAGKPFRVRAHCCRAERSTRCCRRARRRVDRGRGAALVLAARAATLPLPGPKSAQAVLGHKRMATTEIYAEKNLAYRANGSTTRYRWSPRRVTWAGCGGGSCAPGAGRCDLPTAGPKDVTRRQTLRLPALLRPDVRYHYSDTLPWL